MLHVGFTCLRTIFERYIATSARLDELLFRLLVRVVEWRLGKYNAQDLANAAWGYAAVAQLDVQLFMGLANAAE